MARVQKQVGRVLIGRVLSYAALADHRIEPVMIPFKGKALPG